MNKETPSIRIIESADGSHTLLHEGLSETYHSTHGAVQESEHVFIKEGLEKAIQDGVKLISIFEVGFGTGLNAYLTYKKILGSSVQVVYHTIEPFPLDLSIIGQLNYTKQEGNSEVKDFFSKIHQAPWDSVVSMDSQFTLFKIKGKFEETPIQSSHYDLIYFDAFAPSKQAEMWVPENIAKTFFMLRKGGMLVTYCAKGQFKRDLKAAGFEVEALPGPPGKKEMTRAVKP